MKLRDALSARLGQQVEILTDQPNRGDPNEFLFVEDVTCNGTRLDVDPAMVAEAIAAAPPRKTRVQRFLEEFDAAVVPNASLPRCGTSSPPWIRWPDNHD